MAVIQGNQGQTGKQVGQNVTAGMGEFSDQLKTDLRARYSQLNYRKQEFLIDSGSVTVASANATKGSLGTLQFINGFWNPPNSGLNAEIIAAGMALISGTPAGPLVWNYIPNPGIVSSTPTGTIQAGVLGSSTPSGMKPMVNVALVVQPANTATAATQLAPLGGQAASAAGAGVNSLETEYAGRIIVPPNTLVGLTSWGTGTTHIVDAWIVWQEVPV